MIPAVLTPLTDDAAAVSAKRLGPYVDALVEAGVTGLFIGGTMGEGPLLTVEERRTLAELTVAAARGRVAVAVHVGSIVTRNSVELARHAREAGADAVAAVPPFYYPLDEGELARYYQAISAAAPDLPLYAYNLPSYSRNVLTPAFVSALRQDLPALVGIKESSGDQATLDGFLHLAADGLDVICGADHLVHYALANGAVGSVSSGAAAFPDLYRRLTESVAADGSVSEELQNLIDRMQEAMSRGRRIVRYKQVWSFRGVPLGPVRPPLSDLEPDEGETLRSALEELALLPPGTESRRG